MSPGVVAMMLGAFAVPVALLWSGHRLRKRSRRWRLGFVGALIGHVLAVPTAMVAAMRPAAEWGSDDVARGFLGFWLLLAAPVVGAAIGAAIGAALGAGSARRRQRPAA